MADIPDPAARLADKQRRSSLHADPLRSAPNVFRTWPRILAGYAAACLLIAAATAIGLMLPGPDERPRLFVLLPAIALSSWLYGGGPGILSVLLSVLVGCFFLAPPRYSLRLDPHMAPLVLAFAVIATATAVTMWRLRRQQESLRYLSAIISSSDDAIIGKTLDGTITSWNSGAEKLYGHAAREVIGTSIFRLVPPEDQEPTQELMRRVGRGERIDHYQTTRLRQDGSLVPVSLGMSPILDSDGHLTGVSTIARDMSEHRQVEQAAVDARQVADTRLAQLRATLDNLSEAVYVCDAEGRTLLVNPAYRRLSGWQEETPPPRMEPFAGVELFELSGVPLPRTAWPVNAALRGEEVKGRELRRLRRGNQKDEYAIIRYNASPVRDAAGKVVMAVVSMEDVTAAKLSQRALIRAEKLASVGRMAATIAHEINNPLAAVMNAIFLASTTPHLPAEAATNLGLAEKELNRVAHITRQTLGFYKESQTPAAVKLPELVDGIVDLYAPKLRNKAIAVDRHYRFGREGETIEAVEGEIRQVISNLIANSIDALPINGRLRLRISPATGDGCRPMLRLTIADNGGGIAPEHLPRIFEPFFTTKLAVGTGLGLWVTSELVKKHEGKIRVRSRAGKGTVFTVWLPRERRRQQRARIA